MKQSFSGFILPKPDKKANVVHGVQDYPTPGTYQFRIPGGVTRLYALLGAGGGSGGTMYIDNRYPGGGGGGGGNCAGTIDVLPGQILTVFVGGSGSVSAIQMPDGSQPLTATPGSQGYDGSYGAGGAAGSGTGGEVGPGAAGSSATGSGNISTGVGGLGGRGAKPYGGDGGQGYYASGGSVGGIGHVKIWW